MTVSGSIKKLAELRIVKRSECQHDTRAKNVVLTKKGISLIQKIVPIVESIDQKFFSCFDKSQQNSFTQTLHLLVSQN